MNDKKPIKQVFVRNLSYDTTQDDLISLFEEHGPLKRAIVVKDEDGKSKGFGFVHYSLESHATKAVEKLQNYEFNGRKMKLELAIPESQEDQKKLAKEKGSGYQGILSNNNQVKDDKNQNEIFKLKSNKLESSGKADTIKKARRIVICGIPLGIKKNALKILLSKSVRNVSKVEALIPGKDYDGLIVEEENPVIYPTGKCVLVTTAKKKEASKLVTTVDGMPVGRLIAVSAGNAGAPKKEKGHLMARLCSNVTLSQLRKRHCRVIIRNLSFQATEENVATKLGKYGPLVEVAIPMVDPYAKTNDDNHDKGLDNHDSSEELGGNATNVTSVTNAANADIQGNGEADKVNKATIENGYGNSEIPSKRSRNRDKDGSKLRPRGYAFVTFLCADDAANAVAASADGALKICNRAVAIDHCQNKHHYQREDMDENTEEGVNRDANVEDADDGSSSSSSDSDSDGSSSSSSGSSSDSDSDSDSVVSDKEDLPDSGIKVDHINGNENEDSDNDEDADEDEDEDDGNMSVDKVARAETDEKDSAPSRPPRPSDVKEGATVFIRDLSYDSTEADIRMVMYRFGRVRTVKIVMDENGACKGTAFVKFGSKIEADLCVAVGHGLGSAEELNNNPEVEPQLPGAGHIFILDRAVRVDKAVERSHAKQLSETAGEARACLDKRHLYLAEVGLSITGIAKHHMSDADKEKRARAISEKKKKLINPLNFVSPTRITVRNLDKGVKQGDLKTQCLTALRRAMARDAVQSSDLERLLIAQGVPARDRTTAAITVPEIEKGAIKSIRLMVDNERLRSGIPQSRGYAFVEFRHHAYALAVLREMNHSQEYAFLASGKGKGIPKKVLMSDVNINHRQNPGVSKADLEAAQAEKNQSEAMKGTRLIVDFCTEDIQKVQVLRQREERLLKLQHEHDAKDTTKNTNDNKKHKKNRKSKYDKTIESEDKDGDNDDDGDGDEDEDGSGNEMMVDRLAEEEEDGSDGDDEKEGGTSSSTAVGHKSKSPKGMTLKQKQSLKRQRKEEENQQKKKQKSKQKAAVTARKELKRLGRTEQRLQRKQVQEELKKKVKK